MPRQTRWSDLRVGLAALAAVTALVLGILIFGRLGRIPGKTFHVHVRTAESQGIIRGSEVWLAGQKVGAVRKIGFLPPSAGPTNRVILDVELMSRHQQAIRRDSRVDIRPGGTFVGAPVVYLSIGSPSSPVVQPGDTLRAIARPDLGSFADRATEAMAGFPEVMENLTAIADLVQSPDGTVGLMRERGGGDAARSATARMAALSARLRNGNGSAGRFLQRQGELMARARTAMAGADSVRQLIGSNATSLGRFRRDSTLAHSIADLRNEASIVRALLADSTGTIGRLQTDSAIVASLARVEEELRLLLQDVKRHPLRYLPL